MVEALTFDTTPLLQPRRRVTMTLDVLLAAGALAALGAIYGVAMIAYALRQEIPGQ